MLDDNRFFFRFRFPCRYVPPRRPEKERRLDESCRLPSLSELESPDAADDPFELRIGWNEHGLFLSLDVFGKKQRPWCRSLHPEESDGLQLCLDTRDIKDIHRASRFCHRLVVLPISERSERPVPSLFWLPIHRAKGHPNPIDLKDVRCSGRLTPDGYRLDVMIPGDVLTGFEPEEHPRWGFHFTVVDRELGNRSFPVGPPFPVDQDPSLWATLELSRD